MTRISRLAAPLILALAAGEARAQGVIPLDDEARPVANVPMFIGVDDPVTFEQHFGDLDAARARLAQLLASRIDGVDLACGLSPSQRARLATAGAGDVARLLDGVDEARRAWDSAGDGDGTVRESAAAERGEIFRATLRAPGPFGEGSLFARTLRATLDERQAARLAEAERLRRESRLRADVALAVGAIDRAALLSADQRRRFSDLLLAEARAPRESTRWNYEGMMYQASRIPEARLRPIFDGAQWPAVRRQLDHARDERRSLLKAGALPDPATNPPKP